MHQGAEELRWAPKATDDPCRGNRYPGGLPGPPHSRHPEPLHKPGALTAQARGSAETRRGGNPRRGLNSQSQQDRGSELADSNLPVTRVQSEQIKYTQVLPIMMMSAAHGTPRPVRVRQAGTRDPWLQCCRACTWTNVSSGYKIQRNYKGLKITACVCNWGIFWTTRYKQTKKPNCRF